MLNSRTAFVVCVITTLCLFFSGRSFARVLSDSEMSQLRGGLIVGTCNQVTGTGCEGPSTCSGNGNVTVCDGPTIGNACCSSCPQADCGASNWNNCPTTSSIDNCIMGVPTAQNPPVAGTKVCGHQYEFCTS
jgi:hypothetical protein